MSLPPYPSPTGPTSGGQLGLYPLRPLRIGEIFGAALRVAWRHLTVLAPLALLFGALALAVQFGVLASNGSLHAYASGELLAVPVNPTRAEAQDLLRRVFQDFFPAVLLGSMISLIAGPILAGVATPFAALGATSTASTNGAGFARLRGRLPVLLGVGVIVGLAIAIGSVLLVVPGVMVWLILLPAGPVAAMEGSPLRDSIRRAAVVSKGFKGRLLGVSLLSTLINSGIGLVVSSIVGQLVSTDDPTSRLVITSVANVLVAALTTAWSSSVVAMLYIDIRIRREGLAQALTAAAGPSLYS